MNIKLLRRRADVLSKKVKDIEHLSRCVREVETSERSHRSNLIGLGKVFAFLGQQEPIAKHSVLRDLFLRAGLHVVQLTELSSKVIDLLTTEGLECEPAVQEHFDKLLEIHNINDALKDPEYNAMMDLPSAEQSELISEFQRTIEECEEILPDIAEQTYILLSCLVQALTHLVDNVDPFEDYHKMTHTLDYHYSMLREEDRMTLTADCRAKYGPNRTLDEKIIITQRYPRYDLLVANIVPFTRDYMPSSMFNDIQRLHQVIKGQSVILNNNVGVSKFKLKVDSRCPAFDGEMVRVDEVDDYTKIKSRDMVIFNDRVLSLRNDMQSVFKGNLINQSYIITTAHFHDSLLLVHAKKEWIAVMPRDPTEFRDNHLVKLMQGYVDFSQRHVVVSPGFSPFNKWRSQLNKAVLNEVRFPDFNKELYVTWLPAVAELPPREKKRHRRSSVSSISSNSSVSSYNSTQTATQEYELESRLIHLSPTTSTGWDRDLFVVHPQSDSRNDIVEMIIGYMITNANGSTMMGDLSKDSTMNTNPLNPSTSSQHLLGHDDDQRTYDYLPNSLSTVGVSRRRSFTPAAAAAAAAAASNAQPAMATPLSSGTAQGSTTPRQQGRRKSFFGNSGDDRKQLESRRDDDLRQFEKIHTFFEAECPTGQGDSYDPVSTLRRPSTIHHARSRSGSVAGLAQQQLATSASAATPSLSRGGAAVIDDQQLPTVTRTNSDRRIAMNRKSGHFRTVDLSSGRGTHQLIRKDAAAAHSTDEDANIDNFFSELSLEPGSGVRGGGVTMNKRAPAPSQRLAGDVDDPAAAMAALMTSSTKPLTASPGTSRKSPGVHNHAPKPLNIDFSIDENLHDESPSTLRGQIMSPAAGQKKPMPFQRSQGVNVPASTASPHSSKLQQRATPSAGRTMPMAMPSAAAPQQPKEIEEGAPSECSPQ